ncbi:BMC domain-containing protein [Clostridiaceae bacterium 68-1-5]|uniref:BMC domain-containing protein n=1 Tax=Suipraeoptans intestinalis TaxID=2606628 RepID=A0A6N7URW1_9FIRM|nr:BMC domain-containing protein [Suipraeoptans intestinalis]MSR93513.1 BMC domain-containing protein [Suipraeoptans intestinalis]
MEYRDSEKQRIVQELVPGKQLTLAHIIANPDRSLYEKVGLAPGKEVKAAIGVLTVTPAETAIILADIGMKASGIQIGFLDHVSGSLVITGSVSEVEASVCAILEYASRKLDFSVCEITRT